MMKTKVVLSSAHGHVNRLRSTMFATAMACLLLSGVACEKTEPEPKKTSAVKTEKKQAALPAPAPEPEVVYASEIPLFENGQTSWQVVIPATASNVNKFSAEEFVTAIKKISGVEIPIVYADDLQPGNNIVIGSLKENELVRKMAPFLSLDEGNLLDDAIAVHTVSGNLYLAGNNPRSATYAVYHFLREYLGVRWFWPGNDGEFMPKRASFKIPEIAFNYQPPFRYRALTPCGNHGNPVIELGVFRMFMNAGLQNGKVKAKTGTVRRVGGHSIGIDSKEFDKHPDWFAMIDGKRQKGGGVAGCWSNPGFNQHVLDRHAKSIRASNAEILCAFPYDTTQRCQCPDCTKIPNVSARWYVYYAKMVKELQKEFPGLRAAGIAYQEFRNIPDLPKEDLQYLEYVEYCMYNRCYVHPFDDETCPTNKKAMAHVMQWKEKATMGVYGYEFDVFDREMYLPIHNQFALSAKTYRKLNMMRLKTEYPARLQKKGMKKDSAAYIIARLSAYVFAMTAWNPDLDVKELVRDFCKYVYGAGADAMYEYHMTMASYWDSMKQHPTYFGASPDNISTRLLSFSRIRAMKTLLRNAEKAVAAMPDEEARKRAAVEVEVDRCLFADWERIYNLAQSEVFTLNLPKCPTDFDFNKIDKQPVSSINHTHKPTDVRLFWSDEGLHIRVVCKEAGMDTLALGKTGRDVALSGAGVEIVIDTNDGSPLHHFGVTPAGGTYDAVGDDTSWNPDWKVTVKHNRKEDHWTAECFLPFAAFGDTVPVNGTQWKMSIIRRATGSAEACAFTAVPDKEYNNLAIINFSTVAKPGKTVVIISRDPKTPSGFYTRTRNELVANGWQAQNIRGEEELKKANLENVGLIVYETYQNKITPETFRQVVLPAVKNGTVIYFWAYYWLDKLHLFFDDPTYKMGYWDSTGRMRRYSYIHPFLTTAPNKFPNITTPAGVLLPASPESWEVLAKQPDQKLQDRPCIVCRPCGKGLVVISGGLFGNTVRLMNAIIEYNKVVKRDGVKATKKKDKK